MTMLSAVSNVRIIGIMATLYTATTISAFITPPVKKTLLTRKWQPQFANQNDANELFKSESWGPIQVSLDQVPIFTCANKDGNPLVYVIEMKDETFTVPFFYCDIDDAKMELEKATQGTGLADIGLIPFPLGTAFEMWAQDQAVIVPSQRAISQAGAPPGSNPIGQHVPLFACMEIMQSNEDGTEAVLPLFMDYDEANEAVASAVAMDGGDLDDFEVVTLSLQKAVQLLATSSEPLAFQFTAASKSLRYIQDHLE